MATTDERVDAYLAKLPADQREALGRVRARVAELVPAARETISYGMPGFELDGRTFIWFAGWKSHCSLYPLTNAFLAAHREELAGYGRTKGSVHFTRERPLPDALVDELIRDLAAAAVR